MTDHAIKSGMSCVGPLPRQAATARRAAFSLGCVANVVMKSALSRGAFTDHWAPVGSCASGVIASPVRSPVTRRIHVCLTLRTLRPRASEPLETRCRTPPVRNRPRPPPPTPASRASDIASPTPSQRVRPPPCVSSWGGQSPTNRPARPARASTVSLSLPSDTSQEEQEPSSCRSARAPPDRRRVDICDATSRIDQQYRSNDLSVTRGGSAAPEVGDQAVPGTRSRRCPALSSRPPDFRSGPRHRRSGDAPHERSRR